MNKKAQTTIEYIFLITVILGAFIAVTNYFKRGLQGQWKQSVDQLGDQYDPQAADTRIKHTISSNTITEITTRDSAQGFWTQRTDQTNSLERKSGYTSLGAY